MTLQSVSVRQAVSSHEEGRAFAQFMNQAANGQFRLLFGPRYAEIAAHAYQQPGHDLSYERTLFAAVDGCIVGMASGYTANQHRQSENRLLLEAAGRSAARILLLFALASPVFRFLHACDDGDFYLQFLAVDTPYRGRGIGTALIAAMEERARQSGSVRYTLDVSARNASARRLYEHRGFTIASRWPRFGVLPPALFRMVKTL